MVKSRFGLGFENKDSLSITRCFSSKTNEDKASDPHFSTNSSYYSRITAPINLSLKLQQSRPLTDPISSLQYSGILTRKCSSISSFQISHLLLMVMPSCEQKIYSRASHLSVYPFSSSRYSLAQLGLKGDQNLICM